MTEGTAQTGYLYDANGELLIRRASGDGDTILYFGNTEVRLTVKGTTKTVSGTRYYTANGQTIAVRTAVSGTSGTKLSFLAADHHGTSNVAIEAGTFAPTKRYTTPFGAPRGPQQYGPWPDDKGFLGKPRDTNTGLTHIGARAYDPETGQFISVDPLLELDKHQTLNGYSYAAHNPLTHSDPTGMGLACGNGPTADGCPKRPDGRAGNGRPNEAAKGPFGKHPCNSHCGTAASDSNGQTIYSAGTGEVLACAYGHCVGNVGPSDTEQYIGNFLASILSDGNFWSGIIETAGGAFGVAGGGLLATTGAVECGTGVLCVAGAPTMAAGAGVAAAGAAMIDSGSDNLGRAFREADGKASSGGGKKQQAEESYWKLSEYDGQRVYQRDDPIDPDYFSPKDKYGRSNLKKMQQGIAPIGPDDKPINLHHMLQTQDGPIAEVTSSMHFGNYRQLHWKVGTDTPSGIDRNAFDAWKKLCWKDRAAGCGP
ncbi:HNH/ENDO VII family nuclease [Streptomyces pseudogriseolus]|uniref:HNH/ENDO VII family nuclease n=1 Tax=Streptomyces pseudogriseolus TaxID=36817 RepID=UPI0035AC0D9F